MRCGGFAVPEPADDVVGPAMDDSWPDPIEAPHTPHLSAPTGLVCPCSHKSITLDRVARFCFCGGSTFAYIFLDIP